MLDKQFDKIIKQKMDGIQLNVPGSDWSVFSQKLKTSNQEMLDDAAFDKAILDKVNEPNITVPPADWTSFNTKLQTSKGDELIDNDITDTEFDKAILDKVNEPNITLPPADWASFNSKLQMSKGNDLTDNEFDSFIQDRLELELPVAPAADWSAFSQKMKSANLTDSNMDLEIKSKLGDYSTNYDESHWLLLRNKLVELKKLRKNILSVKWYEGLIAILLFITYANFIAESIHPETNKNIHIASVEKISTSSEVLAANDNNARLPKEIGIATTAAVTTNNKNTSTTNTTSASSINSGSTQNKTSKVASTKTTNNSTKNTNTTTSNTIDNGLGNQGMANSNSSSIVPPTTKATEIASPRNYEASSMIATASDSKDDQLKGLAPLDQLLAVTSLNWDERTNPLSTEDMSFASIETEEKEELSKIHYHIYGGSNYQTISGPRDTLFGKALAENSNNTVYGIGISKTLESIEIMGGLRYQTLSYNPKFLHQTVPGLDGEIYDFYLNKVEYQQLSIPLGLRWHQPLGEKLNLIAELGLNVNFILNSNYETLKELKNFEPSGPAPIPGPGDEEEFAIETLLSRKDLANGLLQGGNIKQNLYASFNSGIGLQYSFTDQFSLYGMANLNQMVGNFKFAANSEKISSIGTTIGVRYTPLK